MMILPLIGVLLIAGFIWFLFQGNTAPKMKESPKKPGQDPSLTVSLNLYENGRKLSDDEIKSRASKEQAEMKKYNDKNAAIENNVCAKLQRELDSMKVNYLTSFTSMDLYALKDIANYVEFVRGSIKATLDDKQKNDIIWKIKSDKDLSELIRGYETNRKGTNGYIRVEGLIRQAVGS